jgi:uncharacterized protein (TIGR03435 family)
VVKSGVWHYLLRKELRLGQNEQVRRICFAALVSSLVFAQNPAGGKLAFEVASVRTAPADPYYYKVDDSRADMGGVSLSELLHTAYRNPWDVVEPDWLAHQTFELHAKFPAGATKEQLPEMLQTFLADRFGLKAHHEERTIPVYAMTVAKGGPKFQASPPGDTTDAGTCNGGFRKQCRQVTMEDLARTLSMPSRMAAKYPEFANMAGALDRPVVDMTGLTGKYTFELVAGRVGGGRAGGGRGAPADPDAEIVSVVDAVKTLGLKLDATKHTYDIIVVDHIERTPTEN